MRKAEKIARRFKQLDSVRSPKLKKWQEVGEFLQPDRVIFGDSLRSENEREKIFDSTPEDALSILAAALHSLLTSPVHAWFSIGLPHGEDEVGEDVQDWLDEVKRLMITKFNSEDTGFHSSVDEFYYDLPTYGWATFFVDELTPGEIRFSCIPLNEPRISENARGIVDTVYREFELSARQIREIFPDAKLDSIEEASKKEPDRMFKIIHAVEPREKYKEDAVRGKDMKYSSIYVEKQTLTILKESGYHEFPYMVARWSKRSGEVYGHGIGNRALPDIRVLNAMNRSTLIAGEKQADPVTLLPHDGFVGEFASDGGAINYYRGTGNPSERVMTLGSDADLNALSALIVQRQDSIRKMFLNDKLQMVGGPQMTATEVIAIQNEKMRILGPVLGRLQAEFLAPLVERVFRIMYRNGELPEAPEEISGSNIRVQYVSPISRAQKQTEAEAFTNAVTYLGPMVQFAPQILENFDFDEIARDSQELFGFPTKYLKSLESLKQERQAAQQAQAEQQEMMKASSVLQVAGQAKEVMRNEEKAS